MNTRRIVALVLALALVVALVVGVWILTRVGGPTRVIEDVAKQDAPIAASKEAARPPALAPSAEPRESVAAPKTAPASAPSIIPTAASKELAKLHGVVLPVGGSGALDLPVTVVLTDRLGDKQRADVPATGEYAFEDLATGRYWIAAQAQKGGEIRQVIDLESGDQRVDLPLRAPIDVLVEIVDLAGAPLRNAPLFAVATSWQPSEWIDAISGVPTTNYEHGSWTENGNADARFTPPVFGRLRLAMPPPVHVSLVHGQLVVATQRVEPGQARVRFALDPKSQALQKGSLHLRLVRARTREPLVENLQFIQASMLNVKSGADGNFTGEFFPGWLNVRTYMGELENPDRIVRIEPGKKLDLGDIELDTPLSISGIVVDEQGKGVPTRLFFDVIEPTTKQAIPQPVRLTARSDAEGKFTLARVSRRQYQLRVDIRDSELALPTVFADAREGAVQGLRIELKRGTPVSFRGADDRWPSVRFAVFGEKGEPWITDRRLSGPEPHKVMLAPGRYEVEVRIGDSIEGARRVLNVEKAPLELSLP